MLKSNKNLEVKKKSMNWEHLMFILLNHKTQIDIIVVVVKKVKTYGGFTY